MTNLRVLRKISEEIACSPLETRFGGPNPMKTVISDTLQFFNGDTWENVPIVKTTEIMVDKSSDC